jgi:hypothetical protein
MGSSRRMFTKEFKLGTVKRLEQGYRWARCGSRASRVHGNCAPISVDWT